MIGLSDWGTGVWVSGVGVVKGMGGWALRPGATVDGMGWVVGGGSKPFMVT